MEENKFKRKLSEIEVEFFDPEYFAKFKELQKSGKLPEGFQLGDPVTIQERFQFGHINIKGKSKDDK